MVDNAVKSIDMLLGRARDNAESYFMSGAGPVQENENDIE
jgi:hypothetical protein